jgi:hypothetical protein
MSDKTCKDRIHDHWDGILTEWDEHKEDSTYLAESFILSADYVEPGTFNGQRRGYYRIQFSWGGPSDELRVFLDENKRPTKIEYWFLDWFDGAHLDVTHNATAQAIVDYYMAF